MDMAMILSIATTLVTMKGTPQKIKQYTNCTNQGAQIDYEPWFNSFSKTHVGHVLANYTMDATKIDLRVGSNI
jgi:hypothetical protein